ncbi:class I SAM-dependent methyltransferase [Sporosarcina sp. Marseille-Q4063]|uniref:class I SAM-dependent methyltransferase n=1 Tax=Sporosarcina sp. Marseille-Q4063 TaxID=2810514 RepID=UPI001BB05CE0|nr:methyltransferase domain-containing protein [Sporosarcina sp. Marseille-Q4063]QUW22157.1 class I SAM-dependent methyltransferase [Sporosarcina sp. Marseille-Q4063]
MEWVQEFYKEQYRITEGMADAITKFDEALVDKVESTAGVNRQLKILELGGGLGLFAVAAAKRGHDVTVIELVPSAVEKIHKLATVHDVEEKMKIIQGDFYEIDLPNDFDVVCYWDGFGVGSDDDQKLLLQRIDNWLLPSGVALIDVYTPWYWAKISGREMKIDEDSYRRYGFDPEGCRMLDTWWATDYPKVTQSLRCYSPADLTMLLSGTSLFLHSIKPGGEMDYDKWIFTENVPLERAMTFLAVLKK